MLHTNHSYVLIPSILYILDTPHERTRNETFDRWRTSAMQQAESCSPAAIIPKKNMRELIVELSIFFSSSKLPANHSFHRYIRLLLFLDKRTSKIRSRTTPSALSEAKINTAARLHWLRMMIGSLSTTLLSSSSYPRLFFLVHDDYCVRKIRWLCPRVLEDCFERCVLDERR